MATPVESDDEPLFQVVKGDPTPAEFAALVAVISAKLEAGAADRQPHDTATWHAAPRWAAYWRRTRQPLRPGPGAWRASALPR
ncbi:acyl-CoA carboxylase subunit epsilon [Actinopolymorpha sp. B17G11]|uniref:acyl-CoA carboxylase subunit epsilon n=1 Tax=unclassified Actinopolymorpha TaxID=2627063 RepID=UPI0032D93EF5